MKKKNYHSTPILSKKELLHAHTNLKEDDDGLEFILPSIFA
jgi:hypothetical protein